MCDGLKEGQHPKEESGEGRRVAAGSQGKEIWIPGFNRDVTNSLCLEEACKVIGDI